MLRVSDFKPYYSETKSDSVSLELESLERISFSAPSGFGKSSLLDASIGLLQSFQGIITWKDKDIRTFSESNWADIRASEMAYVPQGLDLIPHFSIEKNILLNPNFMADAKPLQTMANHLGIGDLLNKEARFLSFGELQRACIIRSLLRPFDILLMDEPFSHLDERSSHACAELINEVLGQRKASLLITSHKGIPETLDISKTLEYA